MFRQMGDVHRALEEQSASTRRILGTLTDENLSRRAGEYRTLGQVAWHIVATIPEMMNPVGLGLSSVDPATDPPTTAAQIQEAYDRVIIELGEALKAGWSDATLGKSDVLYGEEWTRGRTVRVLLDHETHHRGQMTVLLRLLGERVPGIYGPSREEWVQYGQEPPSY
jgi:uncharacterized damage-inducible protein DinB